VHYLRRRLRTDRGLRAGTHLETEDVSLEADFEQGAAMGRGGGEGKGE